MSGRALLIVEAACQCGPRQMVIRISQSQQPHLITYRSSLHFRNMR